MAGFLRFSSQVLDSVGFPPGWEETSNPIAQCEAAIVLATMLSAKDQLAGRDVIWFVDNTAALHSLVKGSSSNAALDRTVQIVHLLAYEIRCRVWFEFISSEQNWADGVSRYGSEDAFAAEHRIRVQGLTLEDKWWRLQLREAWQVLRVWGLPLRV